MPLRGNENVQTPESRALARDQESHFVFFSGQRCRPVGAALPRKANQKHLEGFLEETASDVDYVRTGSLYIAFEEDWNLTQREVRRLNEAGIPTRLWDSEELRRQMPKVTNKAVGGRFIPSDAQLTS